MRAVQEIWFKETNMDSINSSPRSQFIDNNFDRGFKEQKWKKYSKIAIFKDGVKIVTLRK